jgi:hypothetical protein
MSATSAPTTIASGRNRNGEFSRMPMSSTIANATTNAISMIHGSLRSCLWVSV